MRDTFLGFQVDLEEMEREPALEWKGFQPFQIVSLLDMIPILGYRLHVALTHLEYLHSILGHTRATKGAEGDIPPEAKPLWVLFKDVLIEVSNDLELKRTKERLRGRLTTIEQLLEKGKPVYQLDTEITELQRSFHADLSDIIFWVIPPDHFKHYMDATFFGVVGVFSKQVDFELYSAGNCYATQNYSACVFHLMRAVEAVAKLLVRKMKVTTHLVKPVELCDWGTLIRGFEKALLELEKGSKTNVRKKDTLVYYSHAVASFRNFKDAWRNKVSHSHTMYSENDARYIMENTRQFLQHLAPRLKRIKKL